MTLASGRELYDFASRLYPICRSITGDGVRETLRLIGERVPLQMHEIPSGARVFDWEVPLEWNIGDATVSDGQGRRVIDFKEHNLHIVSYSEPASVSLSREELMPRLHTLPEHPDWIPYRTSYYRRTWGFCMRHADRERLRAGTYRVEVKSRLERGSLTYGEALIPGRTRDEVLFFAHVCHPSLANDNTSGISIASALAAWLASEPRRYTYRFVFAPGTIGSLCWLKRNESQLHRVRHGLILALLGDPGPLTYKMSRRDTAEIDSVARYVLPLMDPASRIMPFSPYGYDERQLCSPGFNLPVGRLTRSVNGGYPQYHSSADNLTLIKPECLEQSYEACKRIVTVLEENRRYINLCPKGEPFLGKRGLYDPVGGRSPAEREHALLWVLNQSDGSRSLLDIAGRSSLNFEVLQEAAAALKGTGLLEAVSRPQPDRSARKVAHRKRPYPKSGRAARVRLGTAKGKRQEEPEQ
jgi:aminopeptidase-like protein